VHKHAGLLRAGVATSGNEHRLGANEAPPAIISVFMGDMLTRVIDDIAGAKTSPTNAEQAMIKLGVAKLPEIQKDNTDRNRTSPFAFTGAKFEFRAVGGSQTIAFPVMVLNATVAEAIGELTEQLKAALQSSKSADDAVLKVVRKAFKETADVRFEGNNYADEWVKEAAKRRLPNLRRTPEALEELITKPARALFERLGILTREELESRFHVHMERYTKDMLIELHTVQQMVDTMVLPAAYAYHGALIDTVAKAKELGLTAIPELETAKEVGTVAQQIQKRRTALAKVIDQADRLHEDPLTQAKLLTSEGADRMAELRASCDAMELLVPDDQWPLPKYREMLFPV
jgi:glutamine synthetase